MSKINIKEYFHQTEIASERRYEDHTINSKNIFVRYVHRNRIKCSLQYILPYFDIGTVLDYGCGTGVFVSCCNHIKNGSAVGYEPFMTEKYESGVPIYSNWTDILGHSPYKTITCFEVIEHLDPQGIEEFFIRCDKLLNGGGGTIVFSVPIEIGPVLFIKEISRIISKKKIEYGLIEFIKAAFFCIPGKRIPNSNGNGFGSHKGFDFREIIELIETKGYKVSILGYGPLPIKTWICNSQVFFKAERIQ